MKLYIAGLAASHFGLQSNLFRKCSPNAQLLRKEVRYKLESYHYIRSGNYVRSIREDGQKVFLDSGAFSSFSLGVEVNIDEYAEFIKEHQDIIEMASVLDAIGDPEGTFHNQKRLEQLGVEVLPCFHFGEPLDLCKYYIDNYDYITIGGMVPIPNNRLEPWLDEIWSKVLTDKDGYSRIKIHGFGLTSRYLMERYPWYSVDSSSWVQGAAHGNIYLPEYPSSISISDRSPTRKSFGQHFTTMPPQAQERIIERLAYYGLELAEVSEVHMGRWALNAFTFDRIGRIMGEDHWRKPFVVGQQLLF